MLAGAAAVDIARVVGLVRIEERVLRKELENARMTAASAMNAVNVLVDRKDVDVNVDVDVDVCCFGSVVSDIRKRGSSQLGGASGLYTN
jgi:hypothetical protein